MKMLLFQAWLCCLYAGAPCVSVHTALPSTWLLGLDLNTIEKGAWPALVLLCFHNITKLSWRIVPEVLQIVSV